ncbi:CdiA family toxin C-terminal domain-containing protein [Sphingomonas sp. NCPPB 2930]
MHACLTPRRTAPVLAREAIGPRLCIGPYAFGNVLGQGLAAVNGQVAGGGGTGENLRRIASAGESGSLYAANGNYAGAAGNALEIGANFLAAGAGPGFKAGISAGGRVDDPMKTAFFNAGNALPDSLSYRLDLPEHLAGPGGFTKSGQLSGTHNLDHATAALDAKGATYTLTPTRTDGISELSYSYEKPISGKIITGSKTVYDPSVFSDQTMLDYSLKAGREGWTHYLVAPSTTSFDINHGGVNFRTYINVDQHGNPYVGNVHPIK